MSNRIITPDKFGKDMLLKLNSAVKEHCPDVEGQTVEFNDKQNKFRVDLVNAMSAIFFYGGK